MKLTSPLAPVAASFIATVVFIVLNGYAFGGSTQRLPGTSPSSDHVNVLPQVYHQHDSALFSRDPQIQGGATFATIVWPIIGGLCPPECVPWTFVLLHVASLTAVFFLLWRLAVECCANAGAPPIASAMGGISMKECAQTPIIATPPLAARGMGHPLTNDKGALAGLLAIILFVVIRISPAAEPTYDSAFYTRGAALPLGLAAILCVMRRRTLVAALLLYATAYTHAITAGQMLCVCLVLDWIVGRVSLRRWLMGIAVVISVLSLPCLLSGSAITDSGFDAHWISLQRTVNGSHLFVDLIPEKAWREFAVCGLFLFPALGGARTDRLRGLALAALIGAAASFILGVIGQFTESPLLLQLSPLRGLKLTMVLSLVSASVMAAQKMEALTASGESQSARISAIAAGVAVLALVSRQHYMAIAALFIMVAFGGGPGWLRTSIMFACGAVVTWFIVVDATQGWEQSTRTTWLIAGGIAVAVAILAATVRSAGRIINPPNRAEEVTNRRGPDLALVMLAGLGLLTIPAQRDDVWVYAARDYPWREPSDPWAEAQRWVAANTPVNSLFLVPPWLEGFRTYAQRSEFVEYKMGTLSLFHPAFRQEWASRMALLTPRRLSDDGYDDMAKNYNALTVEEIAAIVERFGITHVVVMASREDLPHRTVYQNGLVRVVEISR